MVATILKDEPELRVSRHGSSCCVWPRRECPPGVDREKWDRLLTALHKRAARERDPFSGVLDTRGCIQWREYKALLNEACPLPRRRRHNKMAHTVRVLDVFAE